MRTNVAPARRRTHEGGSAVAQSPLQELERTIATCLLFENTFYEPGSDIAKRITQACAQVSLEDIGALAVMARNDWKLRHVPLFLCAYMAKKNSDYETGSNVVSQTIFAVVQRPDEMGELLALFWKGIGRDPQAKGPKKIPAQIKKGLREVFTTFSEYQLAKWNRKQSITLKDIYRLVHPTAKDAEQHAVFNRLYEGTLKTPDTWEVALSAGEDKCASWTRLLQEKKLGYMALLMNLRNMVQVGVDEQLIAQRLSEGAEGSRALPFRFLAAARHAPELAQSISDAMLRAIPGATQQQLPGKTVVLVDVSGSMGGTLSRKGETTRMEAASALAVLIREVCPHVRTFSFSDDVLEVPNWRGIPLVVAIQSSQMHRSTYLRGALQKIKVGVPEIDRIIVITDEQSHDGIEPAWCEQSYCINVASYEHALNTSSGWHRINGWSERVMDWIAHHETGRLL